MITISLCMIVKDEEDTLERCLNSVTGVADEIIIVDTGSLDRTKEVAAKFTEHVYDYEWNGDFSAARNASYGYAGGDFILWLDADDILLPEDAVKMKQLKETLSNDTNTVMMKYDTGFDYQGRVTLSCYRERLTRRSCRFRWEEPVHEYLNVFGNRMSCDISVTHAKPLGRSGGRNLEIYENYLSGGRTLSPRGMYYYARELKEVKRYADAILWFNRFLDSHQGWIEDNITACGELARCYLAERLPDLALTAMMKSFRYDVPRAELCCQLGQYFQDRNLYRQAIYWYGAALTSPAPESNWGFHKSNCRGRIPCTQLAVCYEKLGDSAKASEYREKIAQYLS